MESQGLTLEQIIYSPIVFGIISMSVIVLVAWVAFRILTAVIGFICNLGETISDSVNSKPVSKPRPRPEVEVGAVACRLAQEAQAERERKERSTPEYILAHSPTTAQVQALLNSTSYTIRQLAIQAALESKDRGTVRLLWSMPEYKDRALMALMALDFERATDEECIDLLKDNVGFAHHPDFRFRSWWSDWETQLSVRAQRAQKKQQAEERERKQRAAWLDKLRQAEANGHDVCWVCETIDPPRCPWGECISGISPCGSSYGGRCNIHDDD